MKVWIREMYTVILGSIFDMAEFGSSFVLKPYTYVQAPTFYFHDFDQI